MHLTDLTGSLVLSLVQVFSDSIRYSGQPSHYGSFANVNGDNLLVLYSCMLAIVVFWGAVSAAFIR